MAVLIYFFYPNAPLIRVNTVLAKDIALPPVIDEDLWSYHTAVKRGARAQLVEVDRGRGGTGGGRRKGGNGDSQNGGNREKRRTISQYCRAFHNSNRTKRWGPLPSSPVSPHKLRPNLSLNKVLNFLKFSLSSPKLRQSLKSQALYFAYDQGIY